MGWQGESGLGGGVGVGGNRNGEKGNKKRIIILLFIHAIPGTPASDFI